MARLDPQHLRHAFRNKWTARPPPPGDIEAARAILLAAARQVAHAAQSDDDPFENAPQASPPASACAVSREGSPAAAGLPDITFPHIDPTDVAASMSSSIVPPSVKSLLSALLDKDQEDLQALDDESMSLLRDLANRLFRFLRRTPSGTPSGAPKSLPAPTVPVAVQSAEPLTKPQSPPPRPPRSPTRPPPRPDLFRPAWPRQHLGSLMLRLPPLPRLFPQQPPSS